MSAQRPSGRETQAAVKALGSAFIGSVLRYVLLELRAVACDEAALRTAELSFETLRRGTSEVRGQVLPLLLRGARRSFRYMSLKKKSPDVIKADHPQLITNNHNHLTKAFFASWLDVLDICARSGFLMPCMSLMWFFSIMLVANVVLVSVQYLKISTSNQKREQLEPEQKAGHVVSHVLALQSTDQQVNVLAFPSWVVRLCRLRTFLELKDCSQCRHGYFFTDC